MSKKVEIAKFLPALNDVLDEYHHDVCEEIDDAGARAVQNLVQITKQTAPKDSGKYRKNIAWTDKQNASGWNKTFIWFVKAPFHRLTHLLVHGFAKRNGGRVPGNPFLHDALEKVTKEYMENVEDALKHDK